MANVLSKSVPRLDPGDVQGSFERIFDYLFNVMEEIDDTLSRQGVQLGKVNLPDTDIQVKQLSGQVNALASNMAAVQGQISILAGKIDALEDAVAGLTARVEAIEQV